MLFLTYWFVLYAAIVFPLYWVVGPRFRLGLLLGASVVFHTHFAGPAGVLPIVALALLTYLAGLSRNRHLCAAGVVSCVAALVYYKYTRFLCTTVLGALFPSWAASFAAHNGTLLAVVPPLAVSFFAFEFIHYLVDVSRGDRPIRSPFTFALYAVFWPSIVAGPVKRYQDFVPALETGAQHTTRRDVAYGLTRVGIGLVKKFAADGMTAWLAFHGPSFQHLDFSTRWLFVAVLALRILLDFSGYSDIAIGFARMHGIRLVENFNWPYLATNLGEFWRRWHVSLSTWIRDYVYVALGGNRRGLARKVLNGLLAFALCGLWHGAGWNFIVWGLYHGVGLAVASSYRKALGPVGAELGAWFDSQPACGWVLTMLFVGVGWLFFFFPLPQAWQMVLMLGG